LQRFASLTFYLTLSSLELAGRRIAVHWILCRQMVIRLAAFLFTVELV